jgi:hypothetical protein
VSAWAGVVGVVLGVSRWLIGVSKCWGDSASRIGGFYFKMQSDKIVNNKYEFVYGESCVVLLLIAEMSIYKQMKY